MSAAKLQLLEKFPNYFSLYHANSQSSKESIDILRAAAANHLELGMRRDQNEIKVNVFTATADEHGWTGRDSIVQVVMDDMPFIVDSLVAAVNQATRGVIQIVHPILTVSRDTSGQLLEVSEAGNLRESWVEIVVRRLLIPAEHAALMQTLTELLQEVQMINRDWLNMRSKATELLDDSDSAAFVRWLLEDHFTIQGIATYSGANLNLNPESALGLFTSRVQPADQVDSKTELSINKSTERSQVHRSVYFDEITWQSSGNPKRALKLLGLFGVDAYQTSVLKIPGLNRRFDQVIQAMNFTPGSHSYKDLLQFLNAFPRDLLFRADLEWLKGVTRTMLTRLDRTSLQAFLHRDASGKFADVLVYLPRDLVNTNMRLKLETYFESAFHAIEGHSNVKLDENPTTALHFQLRLAAGSPLVSASDLLPMISQICQDWDKAFVETVVAELGDDVAAHHLIQNWSESFEPNYKNDHTPKQALADIVTMQATEQHSLSILSLPVENQYSIRLFTRQNPLKLTAVMPILDAFGLSVVAEYPYVFHPNSTATWWLQELEFETKGELSEDVVRQLEVGLELVLSGAVAPDPLFSLLNRDGCSPADLVALGLVRNYVAAWSNHSISNITQTLLDKADIAIQFAELLRLRLALNESGVELITSIEQAIEQVPSLEQDQILRSLLQTCLAVVRTNCFSEIDPQTAAFAIKVKSSEIDRLPDPKPFAEIWVESARVRGVHIRFGSVARGGLRWSDRLEDLRTEIMGLVRAQIVKNSVIVPTGSKGGFVPKLLSPDMTRETSAEVAISAYQEFITALLSLTDNLVAGEVVPPKIVVWDEADPYLVVAADKGTATFSDYANAISTASGFWLGDAFASGGSNGYDHKAMGITARGAFESVKHHFAELGIDPTKDEITVVGIGDMSGDVFGNGMLLSNTLKLVAAFDHRDIFLDPNPNPAISAAERRRLFELPRSSWQDYGKDLISSGGGVFPRSAKSLQVSPEAQTALGLTKSDFTPNELIHAILQAPVDLLWNGGIGTYVKATFETSAQVGDKATDAIRIDANQLRVRVVGEGGNLGFTQAARIEAALNGVRINSDAIDNSAGVDTSDHEVNLKILLGLKPDLDTVTRNSQLASLTDEIAAMVLQDNIDQNEVLSLAEYRNSLMANVYQRMLSKWENEQIVDLRLEQLPTAAELAVRVESGRGLTKPELGVMLAHVKLQFTDAIVTSEIPDQPWAQRYLQRYFPQSLRDTFSDEILKHPLRREIISTVIANELVNLAGITAIFRAQEETDAPLSDVITAYLFSFEVAGLNQLYQELAAVSWINWQGKISTNKEIRRYQDRLARWFITNRSDGTNLFESFELFNSALHSVRETLHQDLQGEEAERLHRFSSELQEAGIDFKLANLIAGLLDEYAALDLVEYLSKRPMRELSALYFELSQELAGDRVLNLISALERADLWQSKARGALRADMYSILAAITSAILDSGMSVKQWSARNEVELKRIRLLVDEIENQQPGIAALSVLLRSLRNLVNQTQANLLSN